MGMGGMDLDEKQNKMMKVVLMRHGKAADAMDFDNDFERPLTHRGKAEVRAAAEKLLESGFRPDVIMSSPANRTAGTARIIADVFGIDENAIVYFAPLYMGSESDYLDAMNSRHEQTIFIAGHNPTTGTLAGHFGKLRHTGFPTSSFVVLAFAEKPIRMSSAATLQFNGIRQ
ncbi:MAG: histidine phosphatase family protein [Bacteroidetes bacterium]|nr:histidine phosphatase family protein [Bacteroidota bacterium]